MMIETEDPDFVASWQKVEEALKRLDENQVERLFSKKHASLADFHQALTKELELKAAALESAVASLKDESKAIKLSSWRRIKKNGIRKKYNSKVNETVIKRNAMKSVSLIPRLKRNWQKPRRK